MHVHYANHISNCNITPGPVGNDFVPRRGRILTPLNKSTHNISLDAEKISDKILHKHRIKIPCEVESEISEPDRGYLPGIYYAHFYLMLNYYKQPL